LGLLTAQNISEIFFIYDSSKLEKDRYFPFASINFVGNLITDSKASEQLISTYRALRMKVL
jgi:DeoR/GlpR family transcriptional regulator of sugar metabolism